MRKHDGTVESHGVRFRFNFLALLPPTEDQDGTLRWHEEPTWDEADLTVAQRAEVDGWVAEHVLARPRDTEMFARYATLEHNGISHTHREGKPVLPQRPAYGYTCAMCAGCIINPNPGDYLFVGGPIDGRWLVTDGSPVWRVPVLRPVSVRLSRAWMTSPFIDAATYRRVRDRYMFEQEVRADGEGVGMRLCWWCGEEADLLHLEGARFFGSPPLHLPATMILTSDDRHRFRVCFPCATQLALARRAHDLELFEALN